MTVLVHRECLVNVLHRYVDFVLGKAVDCGVYLARFVRSQRANHHLNPKVRTPITPMQIQNLPLQQRLLQIGWSSSRNPSALLLMHPNYYMLVTAGLI